MARKLDASKNPWRKRAWCDSLFLLVRRRRMADQPGSFDIDDRVRRLSDLGDQLAAYDKTVDFELFGPGLTPLTPAMEVGREGDCKLVNSESVTVRPDPPYRFAP